MPAEDRQTLALDLTRRFAPESAANGLARGVCRLLEALGYAPLFEVPLASGRRADVLGLAATGRFAIAEIKSSLADFRAAVEGSESLRQELHKVLFERQ